MVLRLDEDRLSDNEANDAREECRRPLIVSRLNFLRIGVLTSFGVLAQQLWRLQVSDSAERNRRVAEAQDNQLRTIRTRPTRGVIFDRSMKQLVENVPIYVAGVVPGALPKDDTARQEVFDKLAGVLNLTYTVSVVPSRIQRGYENEFYNTVGLAVGWSPDQVQQFLKNYTAGLYIVPDTLPKPEVSPTPAPTATPIPPTVDPNRKGADENRVQSLPTPTPKPATTNTVDTTKPVDIVVGIPIQTAQERNLFALRPTMLTKTQRKALLNADGDPAILIRGDAEYTYDKVGYRYQPYSFIPIKKNLSREQVMTVREKHLELPGIDVDIQPQRKYMQTEILSHALGYVLPVNPESLKKLNADSPNPDHPEVPTYEEGDPIGRAGIEGGAERWLRGVKGYKQVMVDASGRIVREIPETMFPSQPGHNIVLTLDGEFQKKVQDILIAGIGEANKAGANINQGAAVVMNVNTGEVLAMVSVPGFDNNIWNKALTQAEYDALVETGVAEEDKKNVFINRATLGQYAPGSTFKLITASGGLDTGVTPRNKTFTCKGQVRIPYDNDPTHFNTYRCWLPSGHGALDVVGGIKNSCDVFFYNAAVPKQDNLRYYEPGNNQPIDFGGMGIKVFHEYMRKFGIGEETGVEVEEQSGIAPDDFWLKQTYGPTAFWSAGDTLQAGIGQGYVTVTPLQITNMVAVIANGGNLMRPTIIHKIVDAQGKTVRDFTPDIKRKIDVRDDVLPTIREGMAAVMRQGGTADKHIARLKGFQMAGKTGTAEWGKEYNDKGDKHTHAWFAGYAPLDKPEIAVTVLLPFGKGDKQIEGSTFAAPITIDIVRAYFKLPDNPPETPKPKT